MAPKQTKTVSHSKNENNASAAPLASPGPEPRGYLWPGEWARIQPDPPAKTGSIQQAKVRVFWIMFFAVTAFTRHLMSMGCEAQLYTNALVSSNNFRLELMTIIPAIAVLAQ